ncbi:hypothetical protein T484DRAFT_1865448, partial [Baffinella frigidus]
MELGLTSVLLFLHLAGGRADNNTMFLPDALSAFPAQLFLLLAAPTSAPLAASASAAAVAAAAGAPGVGLIILRALQLAKCAR